MDFKKNLFIIIDIEGLNFLQKYIILNQYEDNYLVSFIKIDEDIKLDKMFKNIDDLSNLSKEEVKSYYFNNILDLFYPHNNQYTNIYLYDKGLHLCNENIKQYQNDWYWDNNSYGNSNTLKNYCNYNDINYIMTEHTVFLGGLVVEYEMNYIFPAIITSSDYRLKYLSEKINKHIIRTGPYIHYANLLYKEIFIKHIKLIIGKTLLVFPSHSHNESDTEYSYNEFIYQIKTIASENKFDTIMVCMYFKDIELGTSKIYEENNLKVFSCGHRDFDFKFLNKLKTLISLSDYTMSNAIGTHVGYCIYLNKPHMIYKQEINRKVLLKENLDIDYDLYNYEYNLLYEIFKDYKESISKEQYDFCNNYWGYDYLKTEKELKFILEFYNQIFKECIESICNSIGTGDINSIDICIDYINRNMSSCSFINKVYLEAINNKVIYLDNYSKKLICNNYEVVK